MADRTCQEASTGTTLLDTPTAPQITDFRIMRQTEVAPGWWGAPVEVGETGSATVADRFCTEQNAVTMDPNRSKRIEFYAEPIDATPVGEAAAPTAPLPGAAGAYPVLTFADASADCPVHCAQHEEAEARYAEFSAENGASMARRDRQQLGLHILPRRAVTA